LVTVVIALSGCSEGVDPPVPQSVATPDRIATLETQAQEVNKGTTAVNTETTTNNAASYPQQAKTPTPAPTPLSTTPAIQHYFDVARHSREEIMALLDRAEQIAGNQSPLQRTPIAVVLHGPDMRLFVKQNYDENMDIVDLARRLDTAGVIDFKACSTSAKSRGYSDEQFPSFVEMVPFAPAEIRRLRKEGYVRL